MTEVPHFQLPFSFDRGSAWHAATWEQDSAAEITGCVEAVLRYPLDYRPELPDFGCHDLLFGTQIDLAGIANRVEQWEPRARLQTAAEIDALDALIRHVTLTAEVAE